MKEMSATVTVSPPATAETSTVQVKNSTKSLRRVGKWYFGGVASAMAACCTHPLDLVKVHLQTISSKQESKTMLRTFIQIVKGDGILGLYNGLSASMLRQLTYSTARFAIYESGKNCYLSGSGADLTISAKVGLAASAGFFGGIIGTPGDLINVRMQNDIKLPIMKRRNYKHALDGVLRVIREEGIRRLFGGSSMASTRGALVSIGQMASYDTIKEHVIYLGILQDGLTCHFFSSTIAGGIATFLTMPMDVMKTKMMNAKPGEFSGVIGCFAHTMKVGPSAFYKGFIPAFIRLGPQTVLTFVFLEQLKKYFGRVVYI